MASSPLAHSNGEDRHAGSSNTDSRAIGAPYAKTKMDPRTGITALGAKILEEASSNRVERLLGWIFARTTLSSRKTAGASAGD